MSDATRAAGSTLIVRWLGQAGFVLSAGGPRVMVDPWLSAHPLRVRRPPDMEDVPGGVGWLLATHEHGDHLDLEALPRLLDRYPGLGIVVPEPLRERVEAVVPRARVLGVQPGDAVDLGTAHLSVVHAWHGVVAADGYTDGHGLRADGQAPFVGYVLDFGEVTVYHAGDTVLGPGLVDELRPHGIGVALLPVNGRDEAREDAGILGNLEPAEAVMLAAAMGARILVPMHHDMVRGNRGRAARVVDAAMRAGAPLAIVLPAPTIDVEIGPATLQTPKWSEEP